MNVVLACRKLCMIEPGSVFPCKCNIENFASILIIESGPSNIRNTLTRKQNIKIEEEEETKFFAEESSCLLLLLPLFDK